MKVLSKSEDRAFLTLASVEAMKSWIFLSKSVRNPWRVPLLVVSKPLR